MVAMVARYRRQCGGAGGLGGSGADDAAGGGDGGTGGKGGNAGAGAGGTGGPSFGIWTVKSTLDQLSANNTLPCDRWCGSRQALVVPVRSVPVLVVRTASLRARATTHKARDTKSSASG
jgi:hypothetical protein